MVALFLAIEILLLNKCEEMTLCTSKKRSVEHFGPMLGSCCVSCSYSYSYSYSSPHNIANWRIDLQLSKLPRSTRGVAAFRTAIEYEYEYRFTEYE